MNAIFIYNTIKRKITQIKNSIMLYLVNITVTNNKRIIAHPWQMDDIL